MIEAFVNFESDLLLFIQDNFRNGLLNPVFLFVTTLGNAGAVWIVSSVLLLLHPKTRKIGAMALVALLLSLLVNNLILKNLVARTRPFDAIPGLATLIAHPTDYSFPSGHTASSFAAAGVFFRRLPKRAGIPFLVFAVFIAASRLYVGVHYPSDVVLGLVSGWLLGVAAEYAVESGSGIVQKGKMA